MDALMSTLTAQLLGLSGLGGLAVGLILPRLAAALGVAVFVGILATFVLAATSGVPVPMPGWILSLATALLAAAVGWWIRSRRRA
jgi:hypothetical protein